MEGIYAIFNKSKSRVYVGSSVNLNKRRNAYFSALKRNQHHNIQLQNYYNKYGLECVEFVILEEIENASNLDLIEREEYFIKFYKEKISVFNCIEFFDRKATFKMSVEGRLKISKALTGRVKTEEHKFNLRKNANYEAMALKNTGKKRNEVQINNIRIGQLKSKHKRHSRRVIKLINKPSQLSKFGNQ